jgi:hypothetical protein
MRGIWPEREQPRQCECIGNIVPLRISLQICDSASPAGRCDGREDQAANRKRKDALAKRGRGASKELGIPVLDDRANV